MSRNGYAMQRVLALAGLVQALQQVRQIADTGQGDGAVLETALDSVFRIDAESPSGVYGGVSALRPGLVLLQRYFRNEARDELLPRAGAGRAATGAPLQPRCAWRKGPRRHRRAGAFGARQGTSHPEVLASLGNLYAQTREPPAPARAGQGQSALPGPGGGRRGNPRGAAGGVALGGVVATAGRQHVGFPAATARNGARRSTPGSTSDDSDRDARTCGCRAFPA